MRQKQQLIFNMKKNRHPVMDMISVSPLMYVFSLLCEVFPLLPLLLHQDQPQACRAAVETLIIGLKLRTQL